MTLPRLSITWRRPAPPPPTDRATLQPAASADEAPSGALYYLHPSYGSRYVRLGPGTVVDPEGPVQLATLTRLDFILRDIALIH